MLTSAAASLVGTEGTIQVSQATRGRSLNRCLPVVDRSLVIPPLGAGDVEVVVSTAHGTTSDQGGLHAAGDHVFYLAHHDWDIWGPGTKVQRSGDAFGFSLDQDLRTRKFGAFRNSREGYVEFPSAAWTTSASNTQYVVLSESLIVAHRTYTRIGSYVEGASRDQFMALTLDAENGTGTWSTAYEPLNDAGNFATLGHDGTSGAETQRPYAMCRLDDTHLAVLGRRPRSLGRNPILFILEWTGDGFDTYGPWDMGASSAEAGFDYTGEVALVPCSGNRILAVWTDALDTDNTTSWYTYPYRVLSTQVVSYDLGGHTTTIGPLARFEAGIESIQRVASYPGQDVVVLAGMNYGMVNDQDVESSYYVANDEHIAARTLVVSGMSVLSGAVARIADAPYARTNYLNYWYDFQMVQAGDRLVFIWSDVGDGGGDLMYTKVRVGLTGAGRGGLATYFEGVVMSGGPTGFEVYSMGTGVVLSTGEGLGLVEHYVDDYNTTHARFILVRET